MLAQISVSKMFTDTLSPVESIGAPPPPAIGPGRLRKGGLKVWTFVRTVVVALFAPRQRVEPLDAHIARLRSLAPHLLDDIGVDPLTGKVIEVVEPRPVAATPVLASAMTQPNVAVVGLRVRAGSPRTAVAARTLRPMKKRKFAAV